MMAKGTEIRWYGNKILKGIDTQNVKLVQCVALTISRKAKQRCPVLTGTLKRSIRAIVFKDKVEIHAGGPAGCAPGVGTPVEYAGYVELGTSSPEVAAKPYLRPAVAAFSAADLDKCLRRTKGV